MVADAGLEDCEARSRCVDTSKRVVTDTMAASWNATRYPFTVSKTLKF